jgi:hypothetical protein
MFRVDGERTVHLDSIAVANQATPFAALPENADGGAIPKIFIDRYASLLQLCSRCAQHKFDRGTVGHAER